MNLKGNAALKVEEVIGSADGTLDVTKMWDALYHAFLSIDHHESKYRQFTTGCMRQLSFQMTEYLDVLIHF